MSFTISPSERRTFSANLDLILTLRGYKSPWIANALHVSRQIVHQWRNGEAYPSSGYLDMLCSVLKCTVADFSKPAYAINTMLLMEARKVSKAVLAERLGVDAEIIQGFLDGCSEPDHTSLTVMTEVFECTYQDIIEGLNVTSLSKWAKENYIPITRAMALFKLGILTGAIETDSGILVPTRIKAPEDSKSIVASQKRLLKWSEDSEENLKHNMRIFMKSHDLDNDRLAGVLGVNTGTISHWRSGVRTPDRTNLTKMASVFGVTVDHLLKSKISCPHNNEQCGGIEERQLRQL